jgi:hypothetical protein
MKIARIGITFAFSPCSEKWIAEAEPVRENKNPPGLILSDSEELDPFSSFWAIVFVI